MAMDITRTFQGRAFARYDGASRAGNPAYGKWTMLAVAQKKDDLPILDSFDMGNISGWIHYEFTATSDWHPEKHKWDPFDVVWESIGLKDFELHLHFEGTALPFKIDESQTTHPKWNKLCERLKDQLTDLLMGLQKGGELDEKYYDEVWQNLDPEVLAKQ